MAKQEWYGNQKSAPRWIADYLSREHIALFPAKLTGSAFVDINAVKAVVGVAGAAANATSIPIAALAFPGIVSAGVLAVGVVLIPSGTALYFGASKKLALLTADAKVGDVTLTVQALPTALVSTDTAYYQKSGIMTIPSGTLVGRTYAERDAGTPFGVADTTTPDDEIYLTLFDINISDNSSSADVELLAHNTRIKENYLPNYAALSANDLIQIRAKYKSFKGTD